jgi:hypothetical protein
MKVMSFKANKNDKRGYVVASYVPGNQTEARGADKWGMTIAGGLLLLTTIFVCLLLLAT